MPNLTRASCEQLDAEDPLSAWRDEFVLPLAANGVAYLAGHSLGALPKRAIASVQRMVTDEWGDQAVRGWSDADWMDLPRRIGDKIAPLIGALPGEVLVADSTSVNLFKLLGGALRLRPGRRTILTVDENFPTDLYITQAVSELFSDRRIHTVPQADLFADPDRYLSDDVCVVTLSPVDFRDGALYDIEKLTHAVHAHGALVLWDLSHCVGVIPVDLHSMQADLAVGSTYKYLSGGPGAPAFLFIAERWRDTLRPTLPGWMGHQAPFDFAPTYEPAAGIERHLSGTPPILSLTALDAALDLFADCAIGDIRAKSSALGDLFIRLVQERCTTPDIAAGLSIASPTQADRRGSQVSLAHDEGYPIMQALIATGVIGDFRAPNLMRFGIAPLYTRYADIWDAVETLRGILVEDAWRRPEFQARNRVT